MSTLNIVDFSSRLEQRREQQAEAEALKKFREHYLPNITKEEAISLMECPEAERGNLLFKICFRIDLDRGKN